MNSILEPIPAGTRCQRWNIPFSEPWYYCPESPIIGCREEYYEAYHPDYPNLTGDSWKLRCGFGEDEKLHGTFIQRREVNGDRVEKYEL